MPSAVIDTEFLALSNMLWAHREQQQPDDRDIWEEATFDNDMFVQKKSNETVTSPTQNEFFDSMVCKLLNKIEKLFTGRKMVAAEVATAAFVWNTGSAGLASRVDRSTPLRTLRKLVDSAAFYIAKNDGCPGTDPDMATDMALWMHYIVHTGSEPDACSTIFPSSPHFTSFLSLCAFDRSTYLLSYA
jgi:hypothetical protein